MMPNFSVDMKYVLWLWRCELICAAAVALVLAVATYWAVRRYSLTPCADNYEPPQSYLILAALFHNTSLE